ncbi:hypothetical protein B566_EDAN014812 [Ephemera danica]|nr:hypothetical protein B566_EDAN014812 [Ephemera danica]
MRCLFRVAFVPTDPYDLLKRDPVAFEYLYMQCCNDVVQERFAPELKYDIALRLASLHIQQHAVSNNMAGKLSVKNIEQEFGFERFVPVSLMESMKRKELRKLIGHFLKSNTSGANQGPLTGLQAKLHYLHIIGDLPSYGAKCFSTSLRDSNTETVILVSPKFGISQITGLRNSIPVLLAEIQHMTYITVCQLDELTKQVDIHLTMPEAQVLSLSVEERDAEELVLVLKGYYQLMAGTELPIDCSPDSMSSDETTVPHLSVPPYAGVHHVRPESWNYAAPFNKYQLVNLSVPPTYIPMCGNKFHQQEQHTKSLRQHAYLHTCFSQIIGEWVLLTFLYDVSQSNTDSQHTKTVDSNMNSMTNNANNSLPNGKVDTYFHELGALNHMDTVHCELAESNSDEARRRMSDMQRLVLASQQYLSEQSSSYEQLKEPPQEESDSEGSSHMSSLLEAEDRVSGGGELKHSDSLLLLTQVTVLSWENSRKFILAEHSLE